MDFKRPNQQAGEDIDAKFEQGTYSPQSVPPRADEPSPVAPPPPAPVVKKSGSKGYKVLTSLLIILLLAATGYAVYAYMNEQSLRNDLTAAEARVGDVTTLNTALTNKLSDLKADAATDTTSTDDKAVIIKTVTASANAPAADKDVKVTVTVLKQGAVFATAATGWQTQNDTEYLLKKVGDTWVVIHSGGSLVPKETIAEFAVPSEYQTIQ